MAACDENKSLASTEPAPAQAETQETEDEADIDAAPSEALKAPASLRDYFRWRPLPWWLCFIVGIFLLLKLQIVYNDSPCAVLGTQSPVTSSDVKKAFRTLSMCTHPDRLRGVLKREPTAAEIRRGEVIFNRASMAKEDLTKMIRFSKGKTTACYQGELELALWTLVKQSGQALASLGVSDYFEMGKDFIWSIVTLESGFFSTVLNCLWLSFIGRVILSFLKSLWGVGIIRNVLGLVTTLVIGPLPTILHFFFLPALRCVVFINGVIQGRRPDSDVGGAAPPNVGSEDVTTAAETEEPPREDGPTARERLEKRRLKEDLPKGLRQRKKKETDGEKQQRHEELQSGIAEGAAAAAAGSGSQQVIVRPDPSRIFSVVAFTHAEPMKARNKAAEASQFEMLLILTKPLIPLFMLITMGQVFNGLFSSLLIGHVLRRWVPQMTYEAHHLLCSFFGLVHTIIGVSANQVQDFAGQEGAKLLHLTWSWSLKDVLTIMFLNMHGATMSAMTQLGNEPCYASSFASGLALRIALAQDSVSSLPPLRLGAGFLAGKLREVGIVFDSSDEVVAFAGGGIGDCAGGAFRMLFGDGQAALWAARGLKMWLMLMPALSAAQWLQRTFHAARMLGKKRKMTRFVQRLMLFIMSITQCVLFYFAELNASNGALINFWVAMLFGCVGESLLSTYEVRLPGNVKSIIFLLLFLAI